MGRYMKTVVRGRWSVIRRQVMKCRKSVISYQLSVINKLKLFTVHCSLFTVFCLLFTVYCSLFTVSIAAAEPDVAHKKNGPPAVIIMPFTVYAKDNLSGFRRDLLNTIASAERGGGREAQGTRGSAPLPQGAGDSARFDESLAS